MIKIKRYGWKPDLPDHRDKRLMVSWRGGAALPTSVDLRSFCPPVYDQGNLGSCTANAIAAALEFDLIKEGRGGFTPSRLFIYYNERVLEDSVEEDAGASLRDGCKTVGREGVCPEIQWPYVIENYALMPEKVCYDEARLDLASNYYRLSQGLYVLQFCLAEGYPFVFGFSVYEGFETETVAQTGIVDLPKPNESLLGGHAVLCVGYDDTKERFLVRNSWGSHWGWQGYFTIPYDYVLNPDLANDFWTIRRYAE